MDQSESRPDGDHFPLAGSLPAFAPASWSNRSMNTSQVPIQPPALSNLGGLAGEVMTPGLTPCPGAQYAGHIHDFLPSATVTVSTQNNAGYGGLPPLMGHLSIPSIHGQMGLMGRDVLPVPNSVISSGHRIGRHWRGGSRHMRFDSTVPGRRGHHGPSGYTEFPHDNIRAQQTTGNTNATSPSRNLRTGRGLESISRPLLASTQMSAPSSSPGPDRRRRLNNYFLRGRRLPSLVGGVQSSTTALAGAPSNSTGEPTTAIPPNSTDEPTSSIPTGNAGEESGRRDSTRSSNMHNNGRTRSRSELAEIRDKFLYTQALMRSLEPVCFTTMDDEDKTCDICYEPYGVVSPEMVCELPLRLPKCKHVFGSRCISKWLADSDTCPYCRTRLSPPPHLPFPSLVDASNMLLSYGIPISDIVHYFRSIGAIPAHVSNIEAGTTLMSRQNPASLHDNRQGPLTDTRHNVHGGSGEDNVQMFDRQFLMESMASAAPRNHHQYAQQSVLQALSAGGRAASYRADQETTSHGGPASYAVHFQRMMDRHMANMAMRAASRMPPATNDTALGQTRLSNRDFLQRSVSRSDLDASSGQESGIEMGGDHHTSRQTNQHGNNFQDETMRGITPGPTEFAAYSLRSPAIPNPPSNAQTENVTITQQPSPPTTASPEYQEARSWPFPAQAGHSILTGQMNNSHTWPIGRLNGYSLSLTVQAPHGSVIGAPANQRPRVSQQPSIDATAPLQSAPISTTDLNISEEDRTLDDTAREIRLRPW